MAFGNSVHHDLFVRGQIRQKLQIAGGQDDPIKLKAMIKRQSTQAIDNYDNFHQTIMNLEPSSQIEDSVCQTPQATNHYGASTEETRSQCFTPLTCN